MNKIERLQEALFNLGAYGKHTTRQREVDGQMGSRTKAAIEWARQKGYSVDISSGTLRPLSQIAGTLEYGKKSTPSVKVNWEAQNTTYTPTNTTRRQSSRKKSSSQNTTRSSQNTTRQSSVDNRTVGKVKVNNQVQETNPEVEFIEHGFYNPLWGGQSFGGGYVSPEVVITLNPREYTARVEKQIKKENAATVAKARAEREYARKMQSIEGDLDFATARGQREEQRRANNLRPVIEDAGYVPPAPQPSSKEKDNTPATNGTEHAIYLQYPNFIGKSANALKIGGVDMGAAIGNPNVPVGHAAFILVGPDGTSNYYEYGRYTSGFGHVRPTVKGGNWRRIELPNYGNSENDSTYMAGVQGLLPDTKTGAYQAITIPDVDTQKATEWVQAQANDPNRNEYNITNTCATGACSAVLPFRRNPQVNSENIFNWGGYSPAAKAWSFIPGSTDSYARAARAAGSKVYVMNQ